MFGIFKFLILLLLKSKYFDPRFCGKNYNNFYIGMCVSMVFVRYILLYKFLRFKEKKSIYIYIG